MPLVDIDGEKFNLSTGALEAILEAVDATVQEGVEHGFYFCDTGTELVPGEKCKGTECSINIHDCKGLPIAGQFHSHPKVISFSQPDYLLAVKDAYSHPQHRSLLCVGLLGSGIRCKGLKELPTKGALAQIPWGDTEENREKIKPYFTKKVTVPLDYIAKLIEGVPWEELPPAPHVVAIDEGEGPVPVPPHEPPVPVKPGVVVPAGTGLYDTLIQGGSIGDFILSRQGLPKTVNACGEPPETVPVAPPPSPEAPPPVQVGDQVKFKPESEDIGVFLPGFPGPFTVLKVVGKKLTLGIGQQEVGKVGAHTVMKVG